MSDKSQVKEFREAARELETDDKKRFDERQRKLTKASSPKEDSSND